MAIQLVDRLVGANSPAQGTKAVNSLTLASNTETLFLNAAGGTAQLLPVPGGQLPGATTAPSFGSGLDGWKAIVRVAFKVTTGGTSTAIMAIYQGATITSGNKLATITSQSLVTASASGVLEAHLIWDSVAQVWSGWQQGTFGTATPLASTALSNTAVSVTSMANLAFCFTANLGSNVSGSKFAITSATWEVDY